MRSILSVAFFALGAAAISDLALAQYGPPPAAPNTDRIAPAPATETPVITGPAPLCQANISKGARKALLDLQTAVVAKNAGSIPALVTAAQAVAKTGDDKCFIAQMQGKAAADSKDLKGVAAAIEAQLASGSIPAADIAAKYENLGRLQYDAKAYADAGASFERSMQLAPARGSALVMLAETRAKQNRVAEALPLYQKAIATELGAGRKADENWYKRSIAVAYGAKSPLTYGLSRDWLTAYPSAKNWRDALGIYGLMSRLGDAELLDLFRLARLNRALEGDNDYHRYAYVTLSRGFAGEAKAVLDEGFAAKAIDRNKPIFKEIYASASAKAAGDRASLDGQVKAAQAGAAAKPLMALGEAYYGYGDQAKAAAMFRAALAKSGVDAELANLRLGMALVASGDKAGAKAAFDRVTGARAEIARFWLVYLAARA